MSGGLDIDDEERDLGVAERVEERIELQEAKESAEMLKPNPSMTDVVKELMAKAFADMLAPRASFGLIDLMKAHQDLGDTIVPQFKPGLPMRMPMMVAPHHLRAIRAAHTVGQCGGPPCPDCVLLVQAERRDAQREECLELVDACAVAEMLTPGPGDDMGILRGVALDVVANERYGLYRNPGEPDEHLRGRCIALANGYGIR